MSNFHPIDNYWLYASREELLGVGADPDHIYEDIAENENKLQQAALTKEQCHKLIPEGNYCYKRISTNPETGTSNIVCCPFWDRISDFPKQDNGYCHYMKKGDWQGKGIGLLWDQCKSCGINEYQQDYEEF